MIDYTIRLGKRRKCAMTIRTMRRRGINNHIIRRCVLLPFYN